MTKLHVFLKNGYPKGTVNLGKEIMGDENISSPWGLHITKTSSNIVFFLSVRM